MNYRTLSEPELLKHKRDLNDALRAVRAANRKSAPRVGRFKARSKPSPSKEYRDYLKNHECCMACGRTREQRPEWFNGEFEFHKAHICNKPPRKDVRVVLCLCSACHFVSHGIKYPGCKLPPLTVANFLWLKRESGEFYDPAFIRSCSVQELPEPELLPQAYSKEN